jgi:hypothetical protein
LTLAPAAEILGAGETEGFSMAEMKTKATGASVKAFLDAIPDEQMREDCRQVSRLMEEATKSKARMWGDSIIGFGSRRLRYANGKEVDWMVIAFAPRAKSIALYIGANSDAYHELKKDLGKHSGGGTSCLHIKRLSDVHLPTLKKLVKSSVAHLTREATLSAKC